MTGGINDKLSEIVKGPTVLQELENVDLKTSGEIVKRDGFEKLIEDRSGITKLHEYNDELLFVEDGDLRKFKDFSGSVPSTISRLETDYLPDEVINIANNDSIYWLTYHINQTTNILFYAYILYDNYTLGSLNDGSLVTGVYDLDACLFILKDNVDSSVDFRSIRSDFSTADGTFWIAAVIDSGLGDIQIYRVSDTGTITNGPAITPNPDGTNVRDFVMSADSTYVYLAFRNAASTDTSVLRMTSAGVTLLTESGIGHTHISIDVDDAAALVYVTYLSNTIFRVRRINRASWSIGALTTVDTLTGVYQGPNSITTIISAGLLNIYFDRRLNGSVTEAGLRGIEYCVFNTSTNAVATRQVYIGSAVIITAKPSVVDGVIVVPVRLADPSDADTGMALIEHIPGQTSQRVVGCFYLGTIGEQFLDGQQGFYKNKVFFNGPKTYMMALTRAEIAQYEFATNKPVFRNFAKIVELTSKPKPQAVNFNKYAYFSGSFLHSYDGDVLAEHSFFHSPFIESSVKDTTSGNFSDGPVTFKTIFQYTDFQGNIVRSAPSVAHVVTFSGGTATQRVVLGMASLAITLKDSSKIEILLYRTELAGSVFYLEKSLKSNLDGNANYIVTNSNASTLVQNELLYTESGEDGNVAVTATDVLAVFDSRLLCADLESPNKILYSKPERAEFYQLKNSIDIPSESEDITGLAQLDARLVIFGKESKFSVGGAGPDITGAGNYPIPVILPSEQGVLGPDQLVVTSMGIFFKSGEGIYLLDRGLGTKYVGSPVESFNGLTVQSVLSVEGKNEIRFTTDDQTLVYNYALSLWSVNTTPHEDGQQGFISATIFAGDYVTTNTVDIFRESSTVFSDGGGFLQYQMRFKTAWLKLGDLTGFQRVWRGTLIGRFLADHTIGVNIFYDYETTPSEDIEISVTAGNYEYEFLPARQRCQAIQIEVLFLGDNQNARVNAIEFLVGIISLKNRISTSKRLTVFTP